MRKAIMAMVVLCACAYTVPAQHVRIYDLFIGFGHGDLGYGSLPTVLSEDCLVLQSEGLSPEPAAFDDGLMVVSGLASPEPGFVYVDFFSILGSATQPAQRVLRLGDDALLAMLPGQEGVSNGRLLVLRDLGSPGGYVSSIQSVVGEDLWSGGWAEPAVMDLTTVLIPSPGPDHLAGTSDDRIIVLQGLGTPAYSLTALPLGSGMTTSVTRLSATLAVLAAAGQDGIPATFDDEVVILHLSGSVPSATRFCPKLPVGRWLDGYRGLVLAEDAVAFPTTVGVSGTPDGAGTFTVIRGLPDAPEALAIETDVGFGLQGLGAPHPVSCGPYRMACLGLGPDGWRGTQDDVLWTIEGLDGDPVTRSWPAGFPLGLSLWSRRPALAGGRLVTGTPGPDQWSGTYDDGLVVISGLEGVPTFTQSFHGVGFLTLEPVGDDGVQVIGTNSLRAYIRDLDAPNPLVAWLPQVGTNPNMLAVANPWTLVTTLPGSPNQLLLNDPLAIVKIPLAESYGRGSPAGDGQRPLLAASGIPVLGTTDYQLRVSRAAPSAACALAVSWLRVDRYISPTARLYVAPEVLVALFPGTTDVLGEAIFSSFIPNDPELIGWQLVFQAGILDGSTVDGLTVTNGLAVHY